MNTHPMKLVTIVCEALARDHLIRLLSDEGISGYTLFSVEGAGRKGERMADIAEFANIQVESIVSAEAAGRLLERLQRDFFPHFTMIAYEADIRVLRREKF